MAEVNDDVIDEVTDVTEENNETDSAEAILTEDDYYKEKARREKAEKTLVEQKRRLKELEAKESEPNSKFLTEADLERRDFLKANPELSEYTKELETYSKKGLSLDEAKTLILNSDKARANREKLNSLGLSDGEPNTQKSTVTKSELNKLAETNQKEYNRIRDLMDSGKITMR